MPPNQDFIIPSDGALNSVLYTNSPYLWWMVLLFLLATLALVYVILTTRSRKIRQAIKKAASEELPLSPPTEPETSTESPTNSKAKQGEYVH
jgi:hypothetical protein